MDEKENNEKRKYFKSVFRNTQPWPGGAVDWSIMPNTERLYVGPRSGRVQEATN